MSEVSRDDSRGTGNGLYGLLRQANRRAAGQRRVALIAQGGGMRGIYSMAALMALEELGLDQCFDHVLGSSAGAVNGAYYLAGQALPAVGVYLDHISNRRFVDYWRWRKVLDIDFLVDDVLSAAVALDVDRVHGSDCQLHIILTNARTGASEVVTNRDDIELMEAIRATAAMPVLYNRTVRVGEQDYIDGAVTNSLPLDLVGSLDVDHVVVVMTRPLAYRRRAPRGLLRWVIKWAMRHHEAPLRERLLREDTLYNHNVASMAAAADGGRPRLWLVEPSSPEHLVRRTTCDRRALLQTARMARNDMRKALGLEPSIDNPFGEGTHHG